MGNLRLPGLFPCRRAAWRARSSTALAMATWISFLLISWSDRQARAAMEEELRRTQKEKKAAQFRDLLEQKSIRR